MHPKTAAALTLALVALTGPAVGQGRQNSDAANRPQAAGGAIITGRVFAGDSGVPLRRALVAAQGGGRPIVTQTDLDGRFQLRVPAGRWTLGASKAGYVTLRLGQRRSFESVPPLDVAEGQRIVDADFVLPRGAAITGRVYDELGDPVQDARVQALRYWMVRGRRQVSQTGLTATTDDRGAYRLHGLAPGQYYVSARIDTPPLDRGDEQPLKYASTYFPGTTNVADAQRILVTVGDEQTDVSFLLLPVRTARVSGVVVDASGAPLSGVSMNLVTAFDSADGAVSSGASGTVRSDGSFTLTDVIPGTYTLLLRGRLAPRGNGSGPLRMAYMPLVVPGDLTGVVVNAASGATIVGTVESAGAGQPAPGGVRLQMQPLDPRVGGAQLMTEAAHDGTFTISGVIGPTLIRAAQVPQGWMLERIDVNGIDVTDTFLEFTGTEHAEARVVLTNQVPEVSGRVAAERASPSGYHIVLFPDDPSKWAFPSRYVQSTRSREDGTFVVRALPPHDRYLAVAVDYLEDDEATDPDFLQAIRGAATPFALRGGETSVVELKLVER